MNCKEAEQIIKSKDNISVYYKNTPVWIEKVNSNSDTALVKNLNTDKNITVNVKTLNVKFGLSH